MNHIWRILDMYEGGITVDFKCDMCNAIKTRWNNGSESYYLDLDYTPMGAIILTCSEMLMKNILE